MARKSAKSADHSIVFDSRTNAVMATGRLDGIKEKVQAVKEIVTDRTNDQVSIVLQYYDNSVERTIQAFLEDGAKEALNEWHLPAGTKPSNKRKKKNKKAKDDAASRTSASQDATLAPNTTVMTAPSGGKPGSRPNTGNNSHISGSSVIRENGSHTSSSSSSLLSSSTVQLVNAAASQDTASSFNPSLETTELSSHSVTRTDISTNGHSHSLEIPSTSNSVSPTAMSSSMSSTVSSLSSSSTGLNVNNARTAAPSLDQAAAAAAFDTVKTKPQTASADFKLTINTGVNSGSSYDQKRDTSAKPQFQRPKTLDAPAIAHGVHGAHGAHSANHGKKAGKSSRERTISEQSDHMGGKRPHGGLEKSTKDLHRQSVSLQRLKSVMNEGIEKSTKSVGKMYHELREALNQREDQIMEELRNVKSVANETMRQRQQKAVLLKERIPRASIMSELELAELRADIKQFVSDRKIDEELGSTTRFMADFDALKEEIMKFGEVQPVRANYNHRRPSISSVTSSVISHDDLQSPLSPLTPMTPLTPLTPGSSQTRAAIQMQLVNQSSAARVINQSESVTRYEETELNNKLLGIKTDPKPEGVKTADGNRGAARGARGAESGPQKFPAGDGKNVSRNQRRKLKLKERQREDKLRLREEGQKGDGPEKTNPGKGPKRDAPKPQEKGRQPERVPSSTEAGKTGQLPRGNSQRLPTPESDQGGQRKPGSGPRRTTPRNTLSPSKDGKDGPRRGNPRRTPSPTKRNQPPAGETAQSDTQQQEQKGHAPTKPRNRAPRPRSQSGGQSGGQHGGKAVTVSVSKKKKVPTATLR